MKQPPADETLTELLEHLALERQHTSRLGSDDLFIGHSPPTRNGHLFGGFVFAQAMRAAEATVDGFAVHSAHAYFLRAGSPIQPIEYAVERIRDGRSRAARPSRSTNSGATRSKSAPSGDSR